MNYAPKDRGGDAARIPDDLAKVYANAPRIPEHLDKPISQLSPDEQREKGLIYARHENNAVENMPWSNIEGAEGENWGRVERDMGARDTYYGAHMAQVDPSVSSTLNALGYNFSDNGENLDDPEDGHNRPLTVAELEDRKDRGFDTEINAGIARRFGIDEKSGTRPSEVMAAANKAEDDRADEEVFAESDEATAEPYIRRAQASRARADAASEQEGIAKGRVSELIKPATPPADRANHPGRVVHDPWAADPAGPNEAMNATEAREVMNDNADSIYREHGIHPHDYTDEDIAGYKSAAEDARNNPDNTPPF